jgi:N-methylhydantoinase B
VLADVREGFVTVEAAERDYGVVLTADGDAVDEAATAEKRRNT